MLLDARFRAAVLSDADAICNVYLVSRKHFLPYAPLAHTDEDVRDWIANHLLYNADVSVALVDGEIVGMMAVTHDEGVGWIEQLYVHPGFVGQGVGSQFIDRAKTKLGSPIRLYTFQTNEGARRFYERHGFKAIEYSDGSQNEEKCPDVLYEWRRSTDSFGPSY
jgi:ribosomal protein S18 acetylase RimI-like enzyme